MNLSILRSKAFATPLAVLGVCFALELMIRIGHFGLKGLYAWRELNPSSLFTSDYAMSVPEKALGWKLKPNTKGFYKGQAFSTNSIGFRDRERQLIAHPGTHRIAVLGRSYEMGTGVADGESWPAVLDGRFQAPDATASFGKVEVLNFSVEAYSMSQVELTFHRFAQNYKPDWIIIPIYYEEINTIVPKIAPAQPSLFTKALSLPYWLDQLYLPRWTQFFFWKTILKHGSQDWDYLFGQQLRAKGLIPGEDYKEVAQRIVNAAHERGIQVALVPMPRVVRTSESLFQTGKRLFNVYSNKRKGVVLMSNLDQLQFTPADIATPGDPHLGPAAHRALAQRIYQEFLNTQKQNPQSFWKN